MLDTIIFDLQVALMAAGYTFLVGSWGRPKLLIPAAMLIAIDLAWIGGLFTASYQFFAKFTGEWWLGLALKLGGAVAASFVLSALFCKLFCGKEDEREAAVALLERKRKNS